MVTPNSCAHTHTHAHTRTHTHIQIHSPDSSHEIDKKFTASPAREKSVEYTGPGADTADGSRTASRRSSTGIGCRGNPSVTLDKLSGDSLLSFSYSATLGASSSMSSDSQLGEFCSRHSAIPPI